MNGRPTPAVLAVGETMALVLSTGAPLEVADDFTIDIALLEMQRAL